MDYWGDFELDKIEGKGLMLTKNQELQKGTFLDGKLNGLGYIWDEQSKIEYFG